MGHAKHGVKALGVCLVTILSIMASNAQAATVKEAESTISGNLSFQVVQESASYVLHSMAIGGTKILITCSVIEGNGIITPSATGTGTISFKTCFTELNGAKDDLCLPKEPISANFKVEAYLHNSKETVLVSPETGTVFTTVKLDKGPGCMVGPNFEVKNSAILVDCHEALAVDQAQHLFEQVNKTEFDLKGGRTNSLQFGSNSMQIEGSFFIEMMTKKTWAVHV